MLKRPKPSDTEEDLLAQQKEFLQQKQKSSTAVVKKSSGKDGESSDATKVRVPDKRRSKSPDVSRDVVQMEGLPSEKISKETPPIKKSRFKAEREKKQEIMMDKVVDEHDIGEIAVQLRIVEHDMTDVAYDFKKQSSEYSFPPILSLTEDELSSSDGSKSLFAQKYDKLYGSPEPPQISKSHLQKVNFHTTDAPHLVTGEGISATFGKSEAKKIHKENIQKLHTMSEVDILNEQQKLLEMLDPKLVQFLTSKSKIDAEVESKNRDTDMQSVNDETISQTGSRKKLSKSQSEKTVTVDDLPVQPDKSWLNMNEVETDKLSWMKDLPPPRTEDTSTGQAARFDLQGFLVPEGMDIPVHKGLHHHGDEPERAGYTLEEFFTLCRSSNVQQRILALQCLSGIIKNVKRGAFIETIQTPILPTIVNAGVVFLLRWALDESVESVSIAAIATLHSLLYSERDDIALGKVFSWFQGHVITCYCPDYKPEAQPTPMDSDEKPQQTDADVVNMDIIKGLVTRMDLLERFRYILSKLKPHSETVVQILNILTRIALHSVELAYEIAKCSVLMDLIFKEFLPTSWRDVVGEDQIHNAYGLPLPAAMKLIKCLCQAGKNISSSLQARYQLSSLLLRYLSTGSEMLQIPHKEAVCLQSESYRTWKLLLLYGNHEASQIFIDMYPTITEKLKQLYISCQTDKFFGELNDSDFIGCLEAVVHVAPISHRPNKEIDSLGPPVNWSHVGDLINTVQLIFDILMKKIGDGYQFERCDLLLVTSCLNFITSYYTTKEELSQYDSVTSMQQLENLYIRILVPFWKSIGFQVIVRNLSQFSNILHHSPLSEFSETTSQLPEYVVAFRSCTELPVVMKDSPYGFVVALLRLIHGICRLHKGLIDEAASLVILDEDIVSYMKKVSTSQTNSLCSNSFTKFENILQYFILKINSLKCEKNQPLMHTVCLKLVERLQHGEEFMAHDLMSFVVFNKQFITEGLDIDVAAEELSSLNISNINHLKSATQETVTIVRQQLLRESYKYLSSIQTMYSLSFQYMEASAATSKYRFLLMPNKIPSFFTSHIGEYILPVDWIFQPLVNLYNRHFNIPTTHTEPAHSQMVQNALRWIFLNECYRKNVIGNVPITVKLSRLMCVFLAGNDLFLERNVYCFLAALLREYTRPVLLDQMKFDEDIPGLVSFYDLYTELLQQFQAVSFGDSLFGSYIMVPIQQMHCKLLRKSIWGENSAALRTLILPLNDFIIPIDRYLEPEESDVELLQAYIKGLMSNLVHPKRTPVMYLIAVHHTNRFIYREEGTHKKLQEIMFKSVSANRNEKLKHDLLYYKMVDITEDCGMKFYNELPDIRQRKVDRYTHQ